MKATTADKIADAVAAVICVAVVLGLLLIVVWG